MKIKNLGDSEINGKTSYSTWRKAGTMVTTTSLWYDLSQGIGTSSFNYFGTPLTSKQLNYSTDSGMYVGPSVSTKKFLRSTTCISTSATGLPTSLIMCDYLMVYPFINEISGGTRTLINNTTLSRYTDGLGVRIMPVSYTNSRGGILTFTVSYTNERGVSGRTTASVTTNTGTGFGNIISSSIITVTGSGPFLPLQDGDYGVRSIQSVNITTVDSGVFHLILVRPLVQTQIRGLDAPVEKDYFLDAGIAPEIKNGACLDWIACVYGNLLGVSFLGDIKTIWQ